MLSYPVEFTNLFSLLHSTLSFSRLVVKSYEENKGKKLPWCYCAGCWDTAPHHPATLRPPRHPSESCPGGQKALPGGGRHRRLRRVTTSMVTKWVKVNKAKRICHQL